MTDAPLIIGHDGDFAPFAFVEDGHSRGMLIEMVDTILTQADFAFEFRAVPLDALEVELAAGNLDALAFKAVTAESRRGHDFSEPLITTGAGAFTRPGLAAEANLARYAGLTMVTPRGGPLAAPIKAGHPDIRLVMVDSYAAAIEDVIAGEADVAALNFQVATHLINKRYAGRLTLPRQPFMTVPLAMAADKGRQGHMLTTANRVIAMLKADGVIKAIAEKWMD